MIHSYKIPKSLNLKSCNTENHQEVKQSRRSRTEQTAELPQTAQHSPAYQLSNQTKLKHWLACKPTNCQVQCTAQWKQASKVVTDAKSCCLLRRNLTLCDRRFSLLVLKQSFCHWWELGRSTSQIFSVTDHQTNKYGWLTTPNPLHILYSLHYYCGSE